jgi:hypothetical protein
MPGTHLELVDEQILQDGHLGRLAAHADLGAAFVALGLFALRGQQKEMSGGGRRTAAVEQEKSEIV